MKFILLLLLCLPVMVVCYAQDFSNKGKDFWVGYGSHCQMYTGTGADASNGGTQDMVLYFTSDVTANVTITIPSTGWTRNYTVPANTVVETQAIPKTGTDDVRLRAEGKFSKKSIHITSDKSIVAYAHIYNGSISGASLLFPTNTLGKEYYSLNYKQVSNQAYSYPYCFAIATEDSTILEITPTAATQNHAANVLFRDTLMKGDVLNLLGKLTGNSGVDLTGTKIKSVASSTGQCKRIAVFSGSGKMYINCAANQASSADNYIQQVFPSTAWGQKFFTAPTKDLPYNYFRILVKDPTTVVKLNGVIQSGLQNGFFYDLPLTNQPCLIEADKPILVAQYITTQGACGNGSPGDPEMIYLSPVEQTIDKVTLNSTQHSAITKHYINVIIKTSSAASFKIDGSSPAVSFVLHPQDPLYSYIQIPVNVGSHTILADSGFNAIAYGYGSAESYGYNAGTNIRDLTNFVTPLNPLNISNQNTACAGTAFYFSITYPFQPTSLYWDFHGFQNPDVTVSNPVSDTTYFVNNKQVWRYRLSTPYTYLAAGNFPVSITAGTSGSDGCGNLQTRDDTLFVFNPPVTDFTWSHSGCAKDSVSFKDNTNYTPGTYSYKWHWDFGDGTSDSVRNPKHLFTATGKYTVKFSLISNVGCLSDTSSKEITIAPQPLARFGISYPSCSGKTITFYDSSSESAPGNIVKWFWDYGDGAKDTFNTSTNPTHTYTTGTYAVKLIVLSNTGCYSTTYQFSLKVHPNPVVNFSLPQVCLPAGIAQFMDSSTIADGSQSQFSYLWNFGDPPSGSLNADSIKNPFHSYNNAGPFTVKLQVTSKDGCMSDTTKTLTTVYIQAHADFIVNAENCLNDSTLFTDQSDPKGNTVTNWYWDFGDGQSSVLQNPTHLYTTAKTYTVILYIKTDKGCFSDTTARQVVINPLPIASFTTSSPLCENTTITFSDASAANAGNLTTWNWDFGDGSFLTLNNGNPFPHTYAMAGNYTVTLTVQTDKGCKSSQLSKTITVHAKPIVDFSLPQVCLPIGLAQFLDLTTISDGSQSQFKYLWNFGDPASVSLNTDSVKNPFHNYKNAGPFIVKLQVTSKDGCVSDTTKTLSTIYAQAHADFVVNVENCLNDTTMFTDQSNGKGSTVTNWYWDFGDGQNSVLQNPTHVYATAKTYTVKLYIKTDKGCSSDTTARQVVINLLPTASFATSSPICETKTVTFNNASAANAGKLITWYWNFGDSTSVTLNNSNPFTHTFTKAGNYNVTLIVGSDKGCKSPPLSRTVTVHAQPVVNFILPQVCLSDAFAQFIDSSYISDGTSASFTYLWTFGDPGTGALNTSTLINPKHKYNAVGVYTVTLTITSSSGCVTTVSKLFTVNGSIPKAGFSVLNSTGLCSNTDVQIQNTSTVDFGNITRIDIYWDLANNPTVVATDASPSPNKIYNHLYLNFQSPLTKTFQVKLRAFSGGSCVDETVKSITVNATPKVQFLTIRDTCYYISPFAITQASEIGSVPGSGVYSGPGMVTGTNIFDPGVAGVGTHTIRYTFTSNKGCVDFKDQTINVLAPPVANFGFSYPDCVTRAVVFSDSSVTTTKGLTTWVWNFDDGTVITKNSSLPFTHIFTSVKTFNVTLTVTTGEGCSSTVFTRAVTIHPLPVPDFFSPKICLPRANAQFNDLSTIADGTAGQFTYLWNFGDLNSGSLNTSTQKNPAHIYSALGPYNVTLQVTSIDGCVKDTVVAYNDIHPQPKANFSYNPSSVCLGAPINFTDRSNGLDGTIQQYIWGFGDGNSSSQQNPAHTYSAAGTFNIQLYIINSQGCTSDTFRQSVIVYPYPVVNAGPDINILQGGTAVLQPTVTGNNLQFLWTPNMYISSDTALYPTITGVNDITYKLTVTAQGGCASSDEVFVKVLKFPTIPNTFTPNNDGINDAWVIDHLADYPDVRIQVFNRYGQMVFENKGYAKPWDGTLNGKPLPFGTYYYVIEPGNGRKPITGYVTLIK